MYSPGTVQYRYLRTHYLITEVAKQAKEQWFAIRMLELFDAAAVPYLDQGPRNDHKQKTMKAMQTIFDATNPFSKEEKHTTYNPTKSQATQQDKEKLVNLFGDKPFSSMKDIVTTFEKIKSSIAQAKLEAE